MEPESVIAGPSGDMSWLKALREKKSVRTVLPLYIENEDDIAVVAAVIVLNDQLRTISSSPTGWQQLSRSQLTNTSHIHVDTVKSPVVSFTGDDAATAQELGYELGNHVEEVHGINFGPYLKSTWETGRLKEPSDCNCSGLGADLTRRVEGVSFVNADRIFLCEHSVVHGIEYQGKKLSLETIFNPDWIFGGENNGEFVDLDTNGGEDYILYSPTGDGGRLNRVLATMNTVGMIEATTPFSRYDPEHHEALIYVLEGEVAGYLSWENLDEFQTLRQLFVRNGYRNCGLASTLVRTWCNQFCSGGTYYIDEANEQGRSVIESLGHTNSESEFSAIDLHVLRGIGNSLENADIIQK